MTYQEIGEEKDLPTISVVVPVYNAAPYIRKCLDSIMAQTYPHLEVLAVNDGSTDGSGGICDVFAAKDRRLRVVHFPVNRGPSAARNEGIRRAWGKYITFVDADDHIEPDMLEKLYRNLVENEADISICGFDGVERENQAAGVWSGADAMRCLAQHAPFGSEVSGKLYPAKIAKDSLFDERVYYGEDYLFLYHLLRTDKRVCYLPDKLYHYVRRENSQVTGCVTEKKCRSVFFIHDHICRDATIHYPELLPDFRAMAINGIRCMAVLTVTKGVEGERCFFCLEKLQESIRQFFSWPALARLSKKKAATVLLLYVSKTAFWGAATVSKNLKRLFRRQAPGSL